jgi:eukaryotic-like serine/threonine-protein kinase
MSLPAGTRVGSHEIVSLIGTGGMGEVYRARDVRLQRDVAIKVLPAVFATDPERLARFAREAQVLAALNHPNIAQIYGVEDTAGTPALVMELVEGPTLADAIAAPRDGHGGLSHQGSAIDLHPLPIARQIAEALEAAHEQGIVHRDLKPQNVKLRPDGRVKVLDFGLAKAVEHGAAGTQAGGGDLRNSPTITSPAAMTVRGVVLGTAAYMSPEQARGRPVDRRADIWAFGAVLYEMLTGRQAFGGDTVSDTIAAVLTREPALDALPSNTSSAVRRVLDRCLQKDPSRRFHHMADVRLELEEADASPPTAPPAPPPRRRWQPVLAAGTVSALLAAVLVWAVTSRGDVPVRRHSFTIPGAGFSGIAYSAISPDGGWIAYAPNVHAAPFRLFVRALDGFEEREVVSSSTTTGFNPFFSPDSQWLGFFKDHVAFKVPVSGGMAERLGAVLPGTADGAWADDGTIVVSGNVRIGSVTRHALSRLTAAGTFEPISAPGASESHLDPQVLPGSQTVLFTIATPQSASIAAMPVAGGPVRILVSDARRPRYTAGGHLLFQRRSSGDLVAVRFDPARLEVESDPVRLAVAAHVVDSPAFAVSQEGTLIYSGPGDTSEESGFTTVAVDRSGTETMLVSEEGSWAEPRISPDGRTLLLRVVTSPDCVLWTVDLARGTRTRVTFEGDSHNATWRGDGWLAWGSQAEGTRRIRTAPAAHPTKIMDVATGERDRVPESWSPDGTRLAFTETHPETGQDVWVLGAENGTAAPFAASTFNEHTARFSGDGRWIAFVSDESGRDEVYVQPATGDGGRLQISVQGGTSPLWSPRGGELFYVAGNQLMAVDIQLGQGPPEIGLPRKVLDGPYVLERLGNYDITPDGRRFVLVRRRGDSDPTATLRVVLNWTAALRSGAR